MIPSEHYAEAERLLKRASELMPMEAAPVIAVAQVHATLAGAYMPSASRSQAKTFGTETWGSEDAWGGKKPEDTDPHRP